MSGNTGAPGSLTWQGFLDVMIIFAGLFGFLVCLGLVIILIYCPIYFIYQRCKDRDIPSRGVKVGQVKDEESGVDLIEDKSYQL